MNAHTQHKIYHVVSLILCTILTAALLVATINATPQIIQQITGLLSTAAAAYILFVYVALTIVFICLSLYNARTLYTMSTAAHVKSRHRA